MDNNWQYDYSNGYAQPQYTQPSPDPSMGGPEPSDQQPKKKRPGTKKTLAAVALVLVCALAGVGGGVLGAALMRSTSGPVVYKAVQSDGSTSASTTAASGDALTIAQIAEKVKPSVVEVTTSSVQTNGIFAQYVTEGAGSGVIISEDGYILTNNHVIEGQSSIKVTTSDGQEYDATVVGTDDKTDIAVLKIEASGLTPAVIGDSDNLVVGETAVAVGNPLGELGGTVTDGIISALDREVTVEGKNMTLLQTSAAVSPGNSGGGLFNEKGELVGIVNAKSGGDNVEGIGFAVPINTAMEVAEQLIANGYVSGRPAMGIQVIAITDLQTAMQAGVSQLGVYVQSVDPGSAAEQAGLQVGDLFVSVDGTAVSTTSDVTAVLDEHQVGDVIEVQVVRDKQVLSLNVTLQEKTAGTTAQPVEG